MTISVVR